MWSNAKAKLLELLNVFKCFNCQAELEKSFIFGCKHAMYCRVCFLKDGLQCKISDECQIVRLNKFQDVLSLCQSINLIIVEKNVDIPNNYNSTKNKEEISNNHLCTEKIPVNKSSNSKLSIKKHKLIENKVQNVEDMLVSTNNVNLKNCLENYENEQSAKITFVDKDKLLPKKLSTIDDNIELDDKFNKRTNVKSRHSKINKVNKLLNKTASPSKTTLLDSSIIATKGLITKNVFSTPNSSISFKTNSKSTTRKRPLHAVNKKIEDSNIILTPTLKHSLGNVSFNSINASPKELISRNKKGETLLHIACIKGDIGSVKKLLDEGFDPNVKDFANWTPLHEASNHGHADICEILLRHSALVNACGHGNCTPLHDAVINNKDDCVKVLLKHGANVNQRDSQGFSALELATTSTLKSLLEQHLTHELNFNQKETLLTLHIIEPDVTNNIVITISGFDQKKIDEISEDVTKLGWKLVSTFTKEVTHVIAQLLEQACCKRTMKSMSALLLGKCIVNHLWLKACVKKGKWVNENKFLIKSCGSNVSIQGFEKSRLAFKQQLPLLFDGCHFFLSHGLPSHLKEDLTHLLKLGGGQLLVREPKPVSFQDYSTTASSSTCFNIFSSSVPFHAQDNLSLKNTSHFVICPEEDFKNKEPKAGNETRQVILLGEKLCKVNAAWVFDCISHYSIII